MADLDQYNTLVGVLPDGDANFAKVGSYTELSDGSKIGNYTADITITTAQLLALNATPQSLIPAPGAGFIVVPKMATLFLDYNSAAYDGIAAGEDLVIRYTNGSGAAIGTVEATGFLDQTTDQTRLIQFAFNGTPAANAAVVLHMSTGEIATGNSPLKIKLHYDIIKAIS